MVIKTEFIPLLLINLILSKELSVFLDKCLVFQMLSLSLLISKETSGYMRCVSYALLTIEQGGLGFIFSVFMLFSGLTNTEVPLGLSQDVLLASAVKFGSWWDL